jgi:hypothetical protein
VVLLPIRDGITMITKLNWLAPQIIEQIAQ